MSYTVTYTVAASPSTLSSSPSTPLPACKKTSPDVIDRVLTVSKPIITSVQTHTVKKSIADSVRYKLDILIRSIADSKFFNKDQLKEINDWRLLFDSRHKQIQQTEEMSEKACADLCFLLYELICKYMLSMQDNGKKRGKILSIFEQQIIEILKMIIPSEESPEDFMSEYEDMLAAKEDFLKQQATINRSFDEQLEGVEKDADQTLGYAQDTFKALEDQISAFEKYRNEKIEEEHKKLEGLNEKFSKTHIEKQTNINLISFVKEQLSAQQESSKRTLSEVNNVIVGAKE